MYAVEDAVVQYYNARVHSDNAQMDLWKAMVEVFMEHDAVVEWCSDEESKRSVPPSDRLWLRQLVHSELNELGYGPKFAGDL
ncbi:hypothetical protein JDV02_001304 [Purpureocillium takamizusanense]|uniref:Uncharacterized protein n=1 Tax=Purpureocillium takamizusanense TaxID=2060973 RepID=A0A9Q8V7D7_9HYPO|nr:uncharacterized protein JDV02_001304 [Purpureocillium takamizusanense]UNI14702.1 hypothetical protein JDV02_001304 [Purpureocillium takamizusanense]